LSVTRLELSPSWSLAGAIMALHAAAAASVLTVLHGFSGFALAAGFVLLGVAAAWARALLGSAASVRALELSGNDMLLELNDGRRLPVELGKSRHVSRLMVTLPVRRPLRRTVLVARDMLGAEQFRRLRLWALWGKLPRSPAHSPVVAAKQLPA
jgi:hypothetical protein